jgi:hypothetical protein
MNEFMTNIPAKLLLFVLCIAALASYTYNPTPDTKEFVLVAISGYIGYLTAGVKNLVADSQMIREILYEDNKG